MFYQKGLKNNYYYNESRAYKINFQIINIHPPPFFCILHIFNPANTLKIDNPINHNKIFFIQYFNFSNFKNLSKVVNFRFKEINTINAKRT